MPATATRSRTRPSAVRARLLAAIGAACVLLSSVTGLAAAAQAAEGTIVLDRHHTDAVSVRYENDTLVLKTRADLDSGAGQVLEPADVLFHVTDQLKDTVPDLPEFSFLGDAGTPIWKISQSYQPGVLWAGWETESLPKGTFAGETVDLTLQEVTGPGRIELYLNDLDGPRRLLSSTDPAFRTITENVGAHTHANWVFTAPGTYTLTFVGEAERVGGGSIQSAPQTYTFLVGAESAPSPQPSPTETAGETPAPEPSGTSAPTPSPVPSDTSAPTPAPSSSSSPAPAASPGTENPTTAPAGAAVEECVPTAVTTTVRPDNVDVATDGHFDFGPVKEGSTLRALLKDDRSAPAEWKDPAGIVFHLGDAAAAQAPGGQFAFLGSGQVWQIPLTQQSGVPWLGWNTQHASVAGKAEGPVTLTLDNLEGPGDLAVYSVDSWGQLGSQYFGTVSGFPRSTTIEVGAAGVHVHGIWAFTEPGAYYADLTFAGTIDGERVTATSTLAFFVGEGDPRSAVREQTATTYVGRTASGGECQLSLAATGPGDLQLNADLAGLAGASLLVGLAFLGASALAPRRRA